MKLLQAILLLCAVSSVAPAIARLPPPTPEEAASKQAVVQKKARDEAAAKAALARAQDRVVRRYHALHPAVKKQPVPGNEPLPESHAEIGE